MNRIAVLASGSGSNAQALIDATRNGVLVAEIVVVVSNRPHAGVLSRAMQSGIATVLLPFRGRSDATVRHAYDALLAEVVAAFRPNLIVLAGWMLVLTPVFLDRFQGCVINVHPALLSDRGEDDVTTSLGRQPALRGPHAVRDALRLRLPVTGATVHYVTPIVDDGPVILKEEVPIYPDDDEPTLHERIKIVEHRLLPAAATLALRSVG